MSTVTQKSYLNAGQALPAVWPSFLPTLPEGTFLDDIWVAPLELDNEANHIVARSSLLINGNLELGIPGFDAVKLVISAVGGSTYVPLEVQVLPSFAFRMDGIPLALRFSKELLKPVRRAAASGPDAPIVWEVDPTKEYVDIQFAEIGFEINGDGDISFNADVQIDLPPVMLGDSGVVIEAHGIGLYLDANNPPAGQPAGWKGVHIGSASLYLPGELGEMVGTLSLTDAYIGNGGFTGSISSEWTPNLSAQLFGMTLSLKKVEISFVQNALTGSAISGAITLPFFDAPVDVEIAINLNGSFSVRLGDENGLFKLTKPGLLDFELDSLGFEVKDNVFTAMMSGKLKPLLGGLDWPQFEVRELSIDSQGHVHIDGGWLNLREQYALSFYGFTLEITQLGMGNNDDGTRWIGFSGGLKLVDGIKAGASVKGLRVTWGDGVAPSLSLDGVGVMLEIPDVLRFKGEVSYRKLTDGPNTVNRFDGNLKLELLCLNMEIDAVIVFGTAAGPDGHYTFMGLYLGIELPAGIPLWSTGLALYGLAGIMAYNMAPDRQKEEPWYGIAPGEGWYKRPEIGVTDLTHKWKNSNGAFALGAGITIGTLPDNGFTFNGRMLFLLSFPGPVLMIEGKANILKERSSLGEDPLFRCLVVLDFQAGSFLVGLDVNFKYADDGELIQISGGSEMYFSFSDPSSWHLYLGMKDPKERRIRANILSLFEANTYFMLDNNALAMGAWIGFDEDWRFGPVRVTLEAWLESNVKVSWRPLHFYGDISAHGKLEISVFGFGFGFSIDALLEADVFDPFHILGQLRVEISLPWPLPDFDVEVTLEWGPEPNWPLPPTPLKEIAAEHFKVTTSWPLTRTDNLLAPIYANEDGLRIDWTTNPAFNTAAPAPANAPVVPLDARLHVTFSRNVHDKARVGTMVSVVDPAQERIGDPEKNEGPVLVKYSLKEVALDAWRNGGWTTVARRASTDLPANAAGVEQLFGSWAPTPPMPDGNGDNQGQTKLFLWSKNPFDYVRHGGREWQEWISTHFNNMPCVRVPTQTTVCWDFKNIAAGPLTTVGWPPINLRTWQHPGQDGPLLGWLAPDSPTINPITVKGKEAVQGFCLPATAFGREKQNRNFLAIMLNRKENQGVRVHCQDASYVYAAALDTSNVWHYALGGTPGSPLVEFKVPNIWLVILFWQERMCFWRVCTVEGASTEEINEATEIANHNITELERWKNISPVLQPYTDYRLLVRTVIEATGVSPLSGTRNAEQAEYSYFRTEGAPGLSNLSVPIGTPDADGASLKDKDGKLIHIDGSPTTAADPTLASQLNDLALYVRQTMPVTVPDAGSNTPLPRPVYRGYDLGVAFNEDYVSQMYRMDGRDLSLYVYDSNNRPVRDAAGRLIVIESDWDVASNLLLDEVEKTWVTTVNKSVCGFIDPTNIPHDQTMAVKGLVLQPDFVHEARLTPLLLHETFADAKLYTLGASATGGAALGRWRAYDGGSESGPSNWKIAETGSPAMRVVTQTTNVYSLPLDAGIPAKEGTMLFLDNRADLPGTHPDQPINWTDYRVSVQMRSADDDAIGLVFRRSTANRYYRFSMDRERGYRRLIRMVNGIATILGEDDFIYRVNQDYKITVEAIGPDIAVYQDGELVFRVNDASMDHGTIGLYCWASEGAQFTDVRVDDFRANAPTVYRYQFTTSQFVHFQHQLHSYNDEVWQATLPATVADKAVAGAVAANTALTDTEDRAWNAFADQAEVKTLLSQPQPLTTITRLRSADKQRGFLVRCPEPVDWSRAKLTLAYTAETIAAPVVPDVLKITGVTRDTADANKETVGLLLRNAASLYGYGIDLQRLPGPLQAPAAEEILFTDEFNGEGGLLFTETFGSNALDLYEIVDEAGGIEHSAWSVSGGKIIQTSNIYGGSFSAVSLPKPGTMAITGSPDWANVKVTVQLSSGDNDSVGMLFRYLDKDNFYRLEINQEFGYRRLVKKVEGTFSLLWEDNEAYVQNRSYILEVRAYNQLLYGFIDGTPLFAVKDDSVKRGRAGLYCWANEDSRFELFKVETLEADPLFWQPDLSTIAGFTAYTGSGATGGPASWQADAAGFVQTASVQVTGDAVKQEGTWLQGGSAWDDYTVAVQLKSGVNGALGVMFRVVDASNYYRFALDRISNKRRLIKVVNGTATILWQSNAAYNLNQTHNLVITAAGYYITIMLDGAQLAYVYDATFRTGRVALYSFNNTDAHFAGLAVFDAARRIQQWQIVDLGVSEGPSDWRITNGKMKQRSNIWGGNTLAASPDKPGTLAIAGNYDWKNYRCKVVLRSDDNDAAGVVVRYQDAENYYLFAADAERSYKRLVKVAGGVMTTLWNGAGGYTVGDTVTLMIDVIGNRISGSLNGHTLFSVTDATHAQGRIGLYCWNNNRTDFEEITVSVPPQDASALFLDNFQGPGLGAWSIVDKGTFTSPSQWVVQDNALVQKSNIYSEPITAAGIEKEGTYALAGDAAWKDVIVQADLHTEDNDAIGVMFRYVDDNNYYRFSMDSERKYRRLVSKEAGVYRLLWEDDVAYTVGHKYRLTLIAEGERLTGYLDDILVFDVRDFTHASGKIGLYCWAMEGVGFSRLRVFPIQLRYQGYLMEDDFPVLRTFRWQFTDEGDTGGPGVWNAAEGNMLQTSAIRHSDAALAWGTLATDKQHSYTDFRYTALFRSTSTSGSIGLVFRYQDATHYYRFALSPTGGRKLIRRNGNQAIVLWSDAVNLSKDHPYAVTVDCTGSRINIYVNAVLAASVADAAGYTHGTVGLYSSNNTGAIFESVTVATPQWQPYYRFMQKDILAAGTRLRIHSGSISEPYTNTPLEKDYFATEPVDTGDIRFTDAAATLRITAPKNGPEHTIQLLPNAAYATVNTRLLRKGDGTAFVILPADSNPFAAGTYTLTLEYARDNTAANTNSPVFSESGVSDKEVVTLVLPPTQPA